MQYAAVRGGSAVVGAFSRSSSLTDQLIRKFKDGLGINMTMKAFFTLHITSCEKHSTEWQHDYENLLYFT